MNQMNLENDLIKSSERELTASARDSEVGAGLVKLKIDAKVFEVLKRKRRAGETIRMALERAIMTF